MNAITNLLPIRPSQHVSGTHHGIACATVERPTLSRRLDPASGRPVASWITAPPPAGPWMLR
jgi:hypothetical protein